MRRVLSKHYIVLQVIVKKTFEDPEFTAQSTAADSDAPVQRLELTKKLLKPIAYLADYLGYGHENGEYYDIKAERDNIVRQSIDNPMVKDGFMDHYRLKITLADWSFTIEKMDFGEGSTLTEKVPMESDQASASNELGEEPISQKVDVKRTVQTKIETYDLTTTRLDFGTEVTGNFKTPLSFLGGIEVSVKVTASAGVSNQKGVIITTSDSITIRNSITANVPPGQKREFSVEVYGLKSVIEKSTMVIRIGFSVQFDGFLRWGQGPDGVETNYHKSYRGSEDRPSFSYKFGGPGKPFL